MSGEALFPGRLPQRRVTFPAVGMRVEVRGVLPRTRRRSICDSRNPPRPSGTASVKLHGSCTREDGLDRTRAYAEQHNIQVMPPQPVFIIVAPALSSRLHRAVGGRHLPDQAVRWPAGGSPASGSSLREALRWDAGGHER